MHKNLNMLVNRSIDSVPEFELVNDIDKFKLIITSNDYDINRVCMKGIANTCMYQ